MKKVKRKRKINKGIFIKRVTTLFLSLFIVLMLAQAGIASNSEPNYKEVVVKHGDSLWVLAKEYCKHNGDLERAIYEIKTINNKTTSAIFPGEKIKIPLNF